MAASQRRGLAVVVPALDEEENLRRNLPAAAAAADELVVSDGGSRDGTIAVARQAGALVVEGPAGRGGQLHRGAAATRADLLLFLHADTLLPPGAAEAVRAAVGAGAAGGGFLLRFDDRRALLRLGERLINLRTRLTRLPLGDQAQFVTRDAYDALAGFRDWPILEDLDFARRLRRHGEIALLRPPVITSARRFVEGGIGRTIARNWLIWTLYACGVSPHRLARLYRRGGPGRPAHR